MRAPKTGVQYPGMPNQSSAPGEAPSIQTGGLLASIQDHFSADGLSVTVGPTVDYAVYLHEGLGGKDNARPIMEEPLEIVSAEVFKQVLMLCKGL